MRFHNVDVLRCYRHTYREYSHRRTTDNNELQNITFFVSLYASNMQERQSVKILTFWVLPSRTQLTELLVGYSIKSTVIKTFSTLSPPFSLILIQRSLSRNINPFFMTHDVAPGDCCGRQRGWSWPCFDTNLPASSCKSSCSYANYCSIFSRILSIAKQRRFVSKQGHRQTHIHSKARILSPPL